VLGGPVAAMPIITEVASNGQLDDVEPSVDHTQD
jgi:hypothetical protein